MEGRAFTYRCKRGLVAWGLEAVGHQEEYIVGKILAASMFENLFMRMGKG